jgi:hypothetical protein
MTPTARTLKHLKAAGWTCAVVERWNPFARRRVDLFGGDVLAVKIGEPGPLLLQVTTGDHAANRLAKVVALPALREWLGCGGRFAIWSWRKAGPRGARKTWTLTARPVTLADLEGKEVA